MTFLVNLTTSMWDDDSPVEEISAIEISPSATQAEVMLVAALQMNTISGKTNQLVDVITYALNQREYEVAIKAASAIPSISQRESQLSRIAQAVGSNTNKSK